MKLVKYIIYSIMLGLVAYCSHILITPYVGDSPPTEMYISFFLKLPISILAFILSDLWLHSTQMRIIGIVVFASLCLFSVKSYLFCQEADPEMTVPLLSFEYYWKLNGLLVSYNVLGICISHYIKRKRIINIQSTPPKTVRADKYES